jgi:4-hydroxybenzoate polyprenyltransferase
MEFIRTHKEILNTVKPYVDLARPYNATAAMLAFACGYYFYRPAVAWFNAVLGLVLVILLHSVSTMQNDLQDMDVDLANKRVTPLTTKAVDPQSLRFVILQTVFLSLVLAWFCTHKLYALVYSLIYLFFSWLYDNPPFFGSRRPLASIALLGPLYALFPAFFGILLSGNSVDARFIYFALLLTLNRLSISILKDFKDSKGDREVGKRTFYLTFGRKPVVLFSSFAAVVYYPLICLLLPAHHIFIILLVAGAALNLVNRLSLLKTNSEKRLNSIFQKSFIGENYFEVIVLLCLLASY